MNFYSCRACTVLNRCRCCIICHDTLLLVLMSRWHCKLLADTSGRYNLLIQCLCVHLSLLPYPRPQVELQRGTLGTDAGIRNAMSFVPRHDCFSSALKRPQFELRLLIKPIYLYASLVLCHSGLGGQPCVLTGQIAFQNNGAKVSCLLAIFLPLFIFPPTE